MTDDEIDDMTVDSAIKTIKQLRNQLEDYKECFTNLAKERDELWDDLERVTIERDEARREVCAILGGKGGRSSSNSPDAYTVANERGWDCFKEDGK
jgi:predicted nuclease with TOPRIM domain